MQTIFSRLYKPGSSFQQGTLLQLRNLINRRNVSKDTSGKFNETLDFFQLVVECHIMAAAMHFFSMSTQESTPSTNALVDKTPDEKWSAFKAILTRLVSRYVLVDSIANELKPPGPQDSQKPTLSDVVNPHKVRIAKEHNYSMTHQARIAAEHCYDDEANDKQQRQRCLPLWLQGSADEVTTNYQVQKASPDGVFNKLLC